MAEWLFDLGNTRLKCAPLENGRVGDGFAVAHDGRALPDDWGGRAAVDWLARLAAGARFDPEARNLVTVSEVLDRIYGR